MNELLIKENGILTENASKDLCLLISTIKELQEKEKSLRAKLLEEMESRNIIKLEDENLTITYKDSYDKESFDSKKFLIEHPDLYDEYIKITTCKPSLLIKIK